MNEVFFNEGRGLIMKIKDRPIAFFSVIGIGIIIAVLAFLSSRISFGIPFEIIWVNYTIVFVLILMIFWILLLWFALAKKIDVELNTDELLVEREKLAYKFVSLITLFLIVAFSGFLIIELEWLKGDLLLTSPVAILFGVNYVLLFLGVYLQFIATKYYKKYNPNSTWNLSKKNISEGFFTNLDEGEKFEAYRVSYKSFMQMVIIFPLALVILSIISIYYEPQLIAIVTVSALWFVMLMFYYLEGYKRYK